MGVKRFRSVADMPEYPPPAATPLEGLRAACALSVVSEAFGHDVTPPRGVRKFHSVAEAGEYRRAWEEAAVRRTTQR